MTQLSIDSQFNGPDSSGNGGYCCGLFASVLPARENSAIEVTLQSPPPLNTPVTATVTGQNLAVVDGDTLVATATYSDLDLQIPPPPDLAQAEQASTRYRGFRYHPYPNCFVCGPQRQEGDGLRIFSGPVANTNEASGTASPAGSTLVACSWQPFADLADAGGFVASEFIWAALDCPSYFAATQAMPDTPALLGRLTLQQFNPRVALDQRYIISAWPIARQGRKLHAAAALFTQQGECLAAARATWISLAD